jgi:hypothetical protein
MPNLILNAFKSQLYREPQVAFPYFTKTVISNTVFRHGYKPGSHSTLRHITLLNSTQLERFQPYKTNVTLMHVKQFSELTSKDKYVFSLQFRRKPDITHTLMLAQYGCHVFHFRVERTLYRPTAHAFSIADVYRQ